MRNDASSKIEAALPPRAAVAMLTLQLRAARQELESVRVDDSSAAQVRSRLDALMDERRQALDAELAEVRTEAAASVAAAQRAATVMLARARPVVEDAAPPAEPVAVPIVELVAQVPPAPPAAPAPSVEVVEVVEQFGPPTERPTPRPARLVAPETIVQIAEPAQTAPAPAIGTEVERLFSNGAQATSKLVIDAESFAAVFATMVATLMDERVTGWRSAPPASPVAAPVPTPAPVKQSFWTYAKHPDVILLGLTTAIVLVVLAAWLA